MNILKILDWSRGTKGKKSIQLAIDEWCSRFGNDDKKRVQALGFFCMCGESP